MTVPADKAAAMADRMPSAPNDAAASAAPAADGGVSADPIPAEILGSNVPVPVPASVITETNGWLVSNGSNLVAVYAGSKADDPTQGRVVIVRQDLRTGNADDADRRRRLDRGADRRGGRSDRSGRRDVGADRLARARHEPRRNGQAEPRHQHSQRATRTLRRTESETRAIGSSSPACPAGRSRLMSSSPSACPRSNAVLPEAWRCATAHRRDTASQPLYGPTGHNRPALRLTLGWLTAKEKRRTCLLRGTIRLTIAGSSGVAVSADWHVNSVRRP